MFDLRKHLPRSGSGRSGRVRAFSVIAVTCISALALVSTSCTLSDPAPPNWRRSDKAAQKSVRGSWIIVTPKMGVQIAGELVAVDEGGLYIASGKDLITVPYDRIQKYAMSGYQANTAGAAGYAVLGTISTVSHGFALIFTAPIWAISGGLLARSQSGQGYFRRSRFQASVHMGELRAWARFPQGLPTGFGFQTKRRPDRKPNPAVGSLGQSCYRNGTCNDLLRCNSLTRVCVKDETIGQLGGSCYPNATCNQSLVCDVNTGTCKARAALGQEGGRCYANGTCDGLLLCIDGLCKDGPKPSPGPAGGVNPTDVPGSPAPGTGE